VIDRVELIHDGRVIATAGTGREDHVVLTERVRVERSGWLAARVGSDSFIHSAFATSMGAHSSPVYLDVAGQRPWNDEDAAAIRTIIDGSRTWVETIAATRSPEERSRLADYFTSSRKALDEAGR
jgi:hypothetical protein